jgi:hypothetical protein
MAVSLMVKVGVCAAMVAGIASGRITGNSKPSSLKTGSDTVKNINPPFLGFYTKYLDCDGIAIRSASVVNDSALYVASAKVKMMLKHMPIARKNLVKDGAELHIIGKDQQTSDLPEQADQKGKKYMDNGVLTDIDKRTRGVGGLYASCGEENLLQLPNDRYSGGYDICVHEFAHNIMNYGFDTVLRKKIHNQYIRSTSAGLWKGAYAATNDQEYWAELSMWYFGKHGEFLHGTLIPDLGPEGLKKYDFGGYKLLDSIYTGLIQPTIQGRVSVPVQKGAVSGPSIEKTEFTFTNHKSTPVKLYWVDYSGNPKLYATVPPKGHIVQPTFVSHVWMFENDKGEALFYMRINDPPCDIQIKD